MKRIIFFSLFVIACALSLVAQEAFIITKDSGRIEVKVYEVSDSYVKYKPINNQDGPLLKMDSGNILSVEFTNGTIYKFDNKNNTSSVDKEAKVNDAKLYLEKNANDLNAKCPLKLTNVMTLDKVEIVDGVYTYYISLKPCSFSKKFMDYPMEQKFTTVNIGVSAVLKSYKDKDAIEAFWTNLVAANALWKVMPTIVDKNK